MYRTRLGRRCSAGTLLVVCLLCAIAAAPARSHDSLQPPGTAHGWLPDEDWVTQHWVPFDEARLYAALGTDNVALERWLRNDHHTIVELAARRTGAGPEQLAGHLVEPWRAVVAPDQFEVLRARTLRVLTQGHLAQHVLFHYFHGTNVGSRTELIFGFALPTFVRLRGQGLTLVQIGRMGGRTTDQVYRGLRRALEDAAALGVERQEQSESQAAFMTHRRISLLPCFLRRPRANRDPSNPYGEHNGGHGPHPRGVRNGLLRESQQRRARLHPHCCWREPAQATQPPPAPRSPATRRSR
jgi:hypothetical protein